MDPALFDRLATTVGANSSRRRLLGTLLASMLGGAVNWPERTSARKKRKKGKGRKKANKKQRGCRGLRPIPCGDECCSLDETCTEVRTVDGGTGLLCFQHCQDGVQNFDETGTDCGGSCRDIRKCRFGSGCVLDADCDTNVCVDRPDIGGKICAFCRIDSDCDQFGDPRQFRCFRNDCFECALDADCPRPGQESNKRFCVEPLAGNCPAGTPCACGECRENRDCPDGQLCDENNACVGNTCAGGRDFCQDGIIGCNGHQTCSCLMIGGQSTCVQGTAEVGCTSNAQCQVEFGHGPQARCVQLNGPQCAGVFDCVVPCPS